MKRSCSIFGIAGQIVAAIPIWFVFLLAFVFVVANVVIGVSR